MLGSEYITEILEILDTTKGSIRQAREDIANIAIGIAALVPIDRLVECRVLLSLTAESLEDLRALLVAGHSL